MTEHREHHYLHPEEDAQVGEHGLKSNAIGFLDGLIIGIASTAPAYSLAAALAIVVVGVGVQAPAVLLTAFIPMFLIASSFYYMNRADPDCGTTFSWITRAMGPGIGWVGGWAVCTTGILVIGSLAQVAAYYLYDMFELTGLRDSTAANVILTLIIIGAMTTICVFAFYYALNGFSCAIYYRRELTKSVKNLLFIGVGPVVGGLILTDLFIRAIDEYRKVDDSYSGTSVFGIGIPVVLGVGLLLLGVVLMLLWRAGAHKRFFGRKLEIVDPKVASGEKLGVAAVPEEAIP